MARRGREAMNKRARERARQERAEAKRETRGSRQAGSDSPSETDETALMEEFAQLSERHDADQITDAEYTEERRRIFQELGIEPRDDPPGGPGSDSDVSGADRPGE